MRLLALNRLRLLRILRYAVYLAVLYLATIGFIHVLGNFFYAIYPIFPDDIGWILDHWGGPNHIPEAYADWPTDATADIHPVNCVSHNDYWRHVPLYAAISRGCIGAEADVWLVDDDLYVGHRRFTLSANRTLQNLYINPLLYLLEKQNPKTLLHHREFPDEYGDLPLNGVFDTEPSQSFVFLIDFKNSGPELWQYLNSQLAPLREKRYLTHFNGTDLVQRPITVVASGLAPFKQIIANETYRDIFYDAPLDQMADLSMTWPNPNRVQDPTRCQPNPHPECDSLDMASYQTNYPNLPPDIMNPELTPERKAFTFNPTNSYYASVSFTHSIGRVWGTRLSQKQLQLLRGQIRGAHQRGLKVRYWSLPMWPRGLRNHVWHILLREGMDMLNVDDLESASQADWRRPGQRRS